jgi:hypothetical protein
MDNAFLEPRTKPLKQQEFPFHERIAEGFVSGSLGHVHGSGAGEWSRFIACRSI